MFFMRLFYVSFQGENDKSFGSEFLFSDHSKELIVGEIFVRVYNEQPSFPLEVSKRTGCHSVARATALGHVYFL